MCKYLSVRRFQIWANFSEWAVEIVYIRWVGNLTLVSKGEIRMNFVSATLNVKRKIIGVEKNNLLMIAAYS